MSRQAELLTLPACLPPARPRSPGLDSATTFSICRDMQALGRATSSTLLVSLLQPATDVLQQFEEVVVLAGGRVLYHGPVDAAQHWFEGRGFTCPPR